MKITGIEIKNFRGIESLKLKFLYPEAATPRPLDLIVLAGPNGCGKTSVLEACLIALGRKEFVEDAKNKSNVRVGTYDSKIDLFIEHKGEQLHLQEYDSPYKLRAVPVEYFSSWRGPKLIGSVPVTISKKGKQVRETEVNRLPSIKQYFVNLIARKAFGEPYKAKREEKNPFGRINQAWGEFYPAKNETFVAKPAGDQIEEGYDLFLVNHDTNQQISVDALSSGELEIFTMLARFAIKDYSEGIIFIDEPELHLHPAWHRMILRVLRKMLPQTQIICATHSPDILDSVYSYERFTLLSEQDPRITTRDLNAREAGRL